MLNPVTDICWDCIFPISIGAVEIPPSTHNRPDTVNFPSPICVCGDEPGLAIGYWEPIRMVDVTKKPFCMTSLGIEIDVPIDIGSKEMPYENEGEGRMGSWHIHWFSNPLIDILDLIVDAGCARNPIGFDIAYMTELDPLWNNDELAFFLNPETILFGNIVAQAACAADCVAASIWKPLDPLFWCAGCQGGLYPFTANNSEHLTSIQSGSLSVQKFTAKLHRQLQLPITSGPAAICSPIPAPIIKKSQYRIQTTIPVPGIGPYGCNPYGRNTMLHDSFKEIPFAGEDFGYFIWRKTNCCFL
jgi:conjugal transfer pilus assembly protein TraU